MQYWIYENDFRLLAGTVNNMSAALENKIFLASPISPKQEMFAYESLWLGQNTWFTGIAELFRNNLGALPSELAAEAEIKKARERLLSLVSAEKLNNVGVRVHGAGEYPQKLRDADHPVELLYYLGNWELVDTPSIAIVGTRNPTQQGSEYAARIARSMVGMGYTIVSGLAKGIDTAAHKAAIEVGGQTIAVIGTPLFDYYPRENQKLQDYIAKNHLLISQVPFLRYSDQNFRTNRFFFPARNVTMSALTEATVIVEAGNTSGTLIQARAALSQGRKVFILDSCFRNKNLSWPERLEKRGAIRVESVAQIKEALR